MECIKTANLSVAYDQVPVVNQMDIAIAAGKITTIIGPNGCGKSTLLKAVGRILRPMGGSVYLNGKDIRLLPTKEIAKKMAILPQTPVAPDGLTVGELVAYGRYPHQRGMGKLTPDDRDVIRWALDVTKLAPLENRAVDTLSGGQRQKVWIAMALAQQTDLILLDEPTTYLDLAHQLEVLELLQALNREQNRTIIMVLHEINLAARFADHLVAIRQGEVVCCGRPCEVVTPEVLRKVFHIEATVCMEEKTGRPVCLSYDLMK